MPAASLGEEGNQDIAPQNLPQLEEHDGVAYPAALLDLKETGLSRGVFADLCLKFGHTAVKFSSRWIAEQVMLPLPLVDDLLMELAREHLLEVLGMDSPSNHRYLLTQRGHERGLMLMRLSRYLGPAPVSLDQYRSMIAVQKKRFAQPTSLQDVGRSLSSLVLLENDITVLAMALLAKRSLLLWGPAGNGKSSLAKALHSALSGEFWIPWAIGVGTDIIQLFDPSIHERATVEGLQSWNVDQRWVRIKRPLAVAGGEMTLDTLELSFDAESGFYEAPLHMKANHGIFVIDDFGRQRVRPWDLLNRWIVPMEHSYDYLKLRSGRRVQMPFELMLIVATNLNPDEIMDPAFLRRIGYRIKLDSPAPERFGRIFQDAADREKISVPPGLLSRMLDRYRAENRELRGCEPRDLISRVQDICQLQGQELQLSEELMDLAWFGYFGTTREQSTHV